ncbi:DUF2059 domain-containing protein [Thalassotalea sp. SU-HH00458]|uniref:DUF2059 domain-containing protein n=1 Tax=Thalassotalea sp. SU-HH00458 TaxID=3127657 RepID=UPI003109C6B1
MKIYSLALLLILTSIPSYANNTSSRASVEKLMELTEVSKMMDAMQHQVNNMFRGMSQQLGISEKEKPKFNKYMNKVSELMSEYMKWSTFKEPMIDIYTKHFSEKEVQGLIEFYQSDIGKSMTKKMPLVMQDSMVVSQTLMKDLMPKIQKLAMDMKSEIQQSRASAD